MRRLAEGVIRNDMDAQLTNVQRELQAVLSKLENVLGQIPLLKGKGAPSIDGRPGEG
jgi:hypothetical protein